MMIFLAGVMTGALLGLAITSLIVTSGRASEDERVREAYRLGRGSKP
jgi:hypothetical protein